MKYFTIQIKALIFTICCFLLVANFIEAAILYLLPQHQNIYQGETFIIELYLETEEEINTVEAKLKFPSDLIEVMDISKGSSFLTLWPEEPEIKEEELSLIGGAPGGFSGQGLIAKITFLGKEIGNAKIDLKEDSKVLLHDGKGTPAQVTNIGGNYEVISIPEGLPIISSNSHPDQNKWYKNNTLHLHWTLIESAQYSFLLSKDPLVEPDEIPDEPEGELVWMGDMEYAGLEDGIYYFSLRHKLPDEDWSRKITFRAMVDASPPKEFTAEIGKDTSVFEGKYFLSFSTTDETSGVSYFEVKEGKADFKKATAPYLLEDQSLSSIILVKAVDKAGNETIYEIIPPPKPFTYWVAISVVILAVVILAILIWWIIRKLKFKYQKNNQSFRSF